jgi:hypothetical protein
LVVQTMPNLLAKWLLGHKINRNLLKRPAFRLNYLKIANVYMLRMW